MSQPPLVSGPVMLEASASNDKYGMRLEIAPGCSLLLPPHKQLQKQLEDLKAMREVAISVRRKSAGAR